MLQEVMGNGTVHHTCAKENELHSQKKRNIESVICAALHLIQF